MRTLGQIIEACRNGERPDVDELRLAVCAMDALMTFDRRAIWTLAEAEEKRGGRAPLLNRSAVFQRDENFNRVRRALDKSPREYLGPNNNPDDPVVRAERQLFKTAYEKLEKCAKSKPQRGSKTCGCENCRRRLTGGGFAPCLLSPAPTTEPPKKP
ncbi:hypothetical protein ACEUCJ_14950 [Aeromonas rivipollensis]|uniref:hypothetical protein n=1 Tax=Aeromonas rivipollensis TaxID=948519 RepID=UPI0038D13549